MATSKFVGSGVLLFLDQMVFAGGNWFYWIVISLLSTATEIGQTTTVYNLVALVATLTQLGLEYPLLKKCSTRDVRIFGTTLLIVLISTMPAIPILFFLLSDMYEGSFQRFIFTSIVLLIFIELAFVSHFALLGVSAVKSLLIIDTIGTALKFAVGYALTIAGYGALGLLLSFLLQAIFVAIICLVLSIRMFGFRIGKMRYTKEIVREAISNLPSKLSWLILLNLSTVLLAIFGVSSAEVGIFYMALNISFAIGSFVLSMAQMAIPHSSIAKRDLSFLSIRVGLSITAPLIGALIVSPGYILSFLGTQYISGDRTLIVLAVSIFPFSVMINGISKFNYSGQLRKLLLIGFIQVFCFILSFLLLIPQYGILGAAFSVLVAYTASSIPVIIWSEPALRMYIAKSGIAILLGSVLGSLLGSFVYGAGSEIIAIFSSISTILIMNIILKNTSPAEIKQLVKVLIRR
jgi:O-antigen/teichoic acid export membrane protein